MDTVGSIIWDITKCLCGCAKKEADFIYDLEENLKSLEAKWKNLEAIKKDVEAKIKADEETGEKQRSQEVRDWLESIQNIQEEIEEIGVQGAQEIQNKCLCCPKNCKSSYKLGKNVAKKLATVDDLDTKGERFGKDYQITHKLPPKPIDQIPLDETVGQDFIFDKVWKSIEANEIVVIGLYGTGGVGKTTLLKKINNELGKRRPDFFVIWVVVSKEPDLDRIMDNIRKSVGIGDRTWKSCNSQEEKSSKILVALKRKKFVLLLDDVWERLDLSLVGVPHPKDTEFEFKVLFTTRLEDVCAKMQAQISFKVEFLKDEEAWELFHNKVGKETINLHPRIKVLAKEMAAECKGLPLALIVVGCAMAGVKSVEAWESSKNSLRSCSSWTTSDVETKVFSILKLSYDRLPDDTHRKCFLYCALYPEDYKIRATNMIDKWIGEGFLCKDMTRSIHDIRNDGYSVIAKLKLCCLLEGVEDDIIVSRSFKMHDVIRDMALWLACDQDNKIKKVLAQGEAITLSHDDVETWKIVERILITEGWETWPELPITCPNLVTLSLWCSKIGSKNIKCMSKLKVLELKDCYMDGLEEIGGLVLLEYLSLSFMESKEFKIPQELRNLKILKVFNLFLPFASIRVIPLEVISSLQQLRVLKVQCKVESDGGEDSKVEEEFLKEVECLPKIEELNVGITTKNGLNKLFDSSKLQSCMCNLRIIELSDVIIEMPLLLACISKMKHFRQFSMGGLSVVEDSCIHDTTYSLTMLQSVCITNCHSLTHVTWLKHAPFLQQLCIGECYLMEQVIKEDENVDSSSIFSSLVDLILIDLPELKSIHKTALSFPSLKAIKILGCPNLKKLPLHSGSVKHKLTLIQGKEDWWNSLEWDYPAAKHHFQSKWVVDTEILDMDIAAAVGLDFGGDWLCDSPLHPAVRQSNGPYV